MTAIPRTNDVLRHAFEARLASGYAHLRHAHFDSAMEDFEAAHILGQVHTLRHLRTHIALLRWGLRARNVREVVGQLGRFVGAALSTWLWVPLGNPGSTRISAFSPQPIPAELSALMQKASR